MAPSPYGVGKGLTQTPGWAPHGRFAHLRPEEGGAEVAARVGPGPPFRGQRAARPPKVVFERSVPISGRLHPPRAGNRVSSRRVSVPVSPHGRVPRPPPAGVPLYGPPPRRRRETCRREGSEADRGPASDGGPGSGDPEVRRPAPLDRRVPACDDGGSSAPGRRGRLASFVHYNGLEPPVRCVCKVAVPKAPRGRVCTAREAPRDLVPTRPSADRGPRPTGRRGGGARRGPAPVGP